MQQQVLISCFSNKSTPVLNATGFSLIIKTYFERALLPSSLAWTLYLIFVRGFSRAWSVLKKTEDGRLLGKSNLNEKAWLPAPRTPPGIMKISCFTFKNWLAYFSFSMWWIVWNLWGSCWSWGLCFGIGFYTIQKRRNLFVSLPFISKYTLCALVGLFSMK